MAAHLTEKQRRFVEAFLGPAQGNGTQAARLAGCGRRGAAVTASRMLRNANVQKALVARQARKEAVSLLTAADRERMMSEVAQDKTVDMVHRMRALDMLNRCAGAYSMTHILKGRVGIAEVIARSRRTQAPPK